jgi:DNA invertase Pin-like site-specific DNA recombinase
MIRERVCAGVSNARRKGKQLGRKRVVFDRSRAKQMSTAGASVRQIATALRVGRGTVHRFLVALDG